jgi:hypothetical protein
LRLREKEESWTYPELLWWMGDMVGESMNKKFKAA